MRQYWVDIIKGMNASTKENVFSADYGGDAETPFAYQISPISPQLLLFMYEITLFSES